MSEVEVRIGDARTELAALPDESIHCCVTSPPYWGLRDYGTATWAGGEGGCDHLMPPGGGTQASGLWTGNSQAAIERKVEVRRQQFRDICGKCGALRTDSQIGLEPTIEAHIEALLGVFREVKRALRPDGTLWLNLGDSYASAWPCQRRNVIGTGSLQNGKRDARPPRLPSGLKEKDLIGMPWRIAFALQAEGWYLRSDIIWAKPNPMPESVTDRPTRSHEYVFLLTRAARYYYDAEAIREPCVSRAVVKPWREREYDQSFLARKQANGKKGRPKGVAGFSAGGGRNKRSVWTISPRSYKGAHFSTFPEALVRPCILAGCPPGGVVLDPFAGSGTTGAVALSLGRRALLIEMQPNYLPLIERRLSAVQTILPLAGL